ncbi:Multidrug resistance-associated protein 4 [Oopsacas minuta]|uniref:Multidrug resistance-associated protein 4 n=1 Tax=Oopsacas minuta TaxID=111878 RepID=A0AAV7JWA5_9METZ|nr:Multidrug resistance-associated protein 4 [Oopsacas minuta]
MIFIKGVRRNLKDQDLCKVRQQLRGANINRKIEHDWDFISKHTQTSGNRNTVLILKWILITSVCINFFITGVFMFLEHSLNLIKDLLLAALVTQKMYCNNSYTVLSSSNHSNITTNQLTSPLNLETSICSTTLTACVLIGATFGELVTSNLKTYFDAFSSTYLRIVFESIIYRKLLKIKSKALRDFNVIHLISSDTQIFREGIATLHILWIAPIEVGTVIFFMWNRLELYCSVIPGILFLTIISVIQLSFSKKFKTIRKKMLHYGDKRVDIVQNLVANFNLVRLLAWEEPITKLVYQTKFKEDRFLQKASLIRALKLFFFFIGPTVSIYLTAITYSIISDKEITAGQVNAGFLMFAQLSSTLVLEFNYAIYLIKEVNLSLKRIAALLDSPEYETIKNSRQSDNNELKSKTAEKQNLKNGTSLVQLDKKAFIKICSKSENSHSIIISAGENKNVIGISGNITAGNSDLLLSIFGELDIPENLEIYKKGTVVFVPKEGWLFDGDIKENIIFSEKIDEVWYEKVKKLCGIEEEFKYSNLADSTQVMDEGGIKGPLAMKISIARAIYKKADIYLLDEVFSIIELKPAIKIFKNLITEVLTDKIVLIATNQQEILNLVMFEIKMKNEEIDIICMIQKVLSDDEEIPESGNKVDQLSRRKSLIRNFRMLKQKSINITTTMDMDGIDNWQKIYQVKEDEKVHNISIRTYITYLMSGTNVAVLYFLLILVLLAESGSIISLVGWFFLPPSTPSFSSVRTGNATVNASLIIDNQEWKAYIVVSVFVALSCICYLLLCVMIIFILLRCSDALHDGMFYSVLKAKSSFFLRTPVGTIVNRFIQDIAVCDELLPYHFTFFTVLTFQAVGVIALTFSINQVILIPSIIVIVSLLLIFRWIYLKTSRSVRSLESKLCIPLYSQCNITVNGILTIQSHHCQNKLMSHFIKCQDNYSNAYYSNHLVNIWVGIRVGILGICTLALVTAVILKVHAEEESLSATTLGQMILALWMLKHWMLLSIEVENEMISVQRLLSYRNLPCKAKRDEPIKVDSKWPIDPTIEFDDVIFCFAPYLPNLLQQVSFTINSGETIGIVGKNASAVLAALTCLSEFSGTIKIDNTDITKMDQNVLRDSISLVPIDCMVLPGSLRLNLDPLDKATDNEIWEILEVTELKSLISSLPEQFSFDMSKFNQYFSGGQKKLFSLARALLKKNKLLIIDSAINSLDQDTEDKVHKIIRTHCSGYTVIYLTDRLIKLASCEKIMILDGPTIQEYDTLTNLINNGQSECAKILKSIYNQEAEQFACMANTNKRRRSFSKSLKNFSAFQSINVES